MGTAAARVVLQQFETTVVPSQDKGPGANSDDEEVIEEWGRSEKEPPSVKDKQVCAEDEVSCFFMYQA